MNTNEHKLIIVIVNFGFSDQVMDAARSQGARGGTILNASGSSENIKKFLGIDISQEKEIVLIAAERTICAAILDAIYDVVGLGTPGSGIAFALPIDDVVGLTPHELDLEHEKKTDLE